MLFRSRWTQWALAAAAIAGILADSWTVRLPQPSVPPRYTSLESVPSDAAVVELPLGGSEEDTGRQNRHEGNLRRDRVKPAPGTGTSLLDGSGG